MKKTEKKKVISLKRECIEELSQKREDIARDRRVKNEMRKSFRGKLYAFICFHIRIVHLPNSPPIILNSRGK